jgi:serine/threonine protein kinase
VPLDDVALLQDRYQLKKNLGANGAKQTWRAEDLNTKTEVIVKTLYFGRGMEWQDLKLFEREAQTLKSLSHLYIPNYQDSFWLKQPEGDYFCLVQEYIPGISLAEKVHCGWRLAEAEVEVAKIATHILEILIYLHSQNPPVIHRDIKPNNLIWGEDDQVYLVDFGSVQAEANVGRTMTVVGTYGYMPPEQFGGRTVPASDLYGLGATLLFLRTGANPADFPQENLRIQFRDRLQGDQTFIRWLERMIDPSLNYRFQSAEEALGFLHTKEQLVADESFPQPERTPPRERPYGSFVQLKRTTECLDIDIPMRENKSRELSGFGWFMLSFLVLFLMALANLPNLFFSIPCFLFIRPLIVEVSAALLLRTKIHINRVNFNISWGSGILSFKVEGLTRDLLSSERLSPFKWYDYTFNKDCCVLKKANRLAGTTRQYPFGFGLNIPEQEWLVQEIQRWLALESASKSHELRN